jgi:ubiquinone/menaquinone biosynthesis C-methylase UbiE
MTPGGWDGMAAWWDAKQADDGDLWHRALIDPTLLRVLGSVSGQAVLDLACGNGYLSRRLAREGARVVGVDASAAIIERARAREALESLGIVYHVADAARLDVLAAESVEVVVCNMGLMDMADADGALREAARVLRRPGRIVASINHPCFDVPGASGWAIEHMEFGATLLWRKVGPYREVFETTIPWDGPVEGWRTPAYHRPLAWYVRALRAAGFVLTAFEEPEPLPEFLADSPSGAWIREIPLHCVFEAVIS